MESLLRHEIEKLTGPENWRSWKRQVIDVLTMRDVYELVTGEWIEPEPPGPESQQSALTAYQVKKKKFRVALSTSRTVIWTALSHKVQNMITNCETPKEMWDNLYGLKQSPRCWNERVSTVLKQYGFQQASGDRCLYVLSTEDIFLIIVLYVDDGLIAGRSNEELEVFFERFNDEFEITSGPASTYLGLKINYTKDGSIFLHQSAYMETILDRFNMVDCKSVKTPATRTDTSKEGEKTYESVTLYASAIGSLHYAALGTRPDIEFAVNRASQALSNPTVADWNAVKRIFRYLRGTTTLGLLFRSKDCSTITPYSDSDYGGCEKTSRSTSGIVCLVGSTPVTWASRRQQSVALSTTEAELVAATEAAKDIVWVKGILCFVGSLESKEVPVLQIDNAGTIKLIRNPEFHRRTKHIRIRQFYVRELVEEGTLDIRYVSTEENIADILTKPLSKYADV